MDNAVMKQLYAKAIGELVVQYLDTIGEEEIARIREALDDPALDDGACFRRVDAIVSAFHAAGIPTRRHEECE